MKRTLLSALFVIGLLVVWGGSALAAPPANDDLPGMTITEPTEGSPYIADPVDTTDATDESGEPSPCGGISATVWYNFTASTSQEIVVDTSGSDYDTVLAAYTGPSPGSVSFGSLSLIKCNDDFAGLQSELVLAVTTGTTYYFQVGGFYGATGSLVFTVTANGNGDGVTIVTIDIKPGSSPNSINPDSQGVIQVAILTTTDFDADTVDPATVRFAAGEASAVYHALKDVGGSWHPGLIMHFRTEDTGIQSGDTKACLTGTFDGEPFEGCDTVRTVPPNTDTDLDSFGDEVEATLGTHQFVTCYKAGVYLDWPPDLSGDHVVDITDLGTIVNAGLFTPSIGKERFDVFMDGVIDISDLGIVTNFMFTSCQPPPP